MDENKKEENKILITEIRFPNGKVYLDDGYSGSYHIELFNDDKNEDCFRCRLNLIKKLYKCCINCIDHSDGEKDYCGYHKCACHNGL